MKSNQPVEYYTTNSPTCNELVKIFPEGSKPTLKEIQDAYMKLSKSKKKPSNKRREGKKLHRAMIQIGYWKQQSYLEF